MDLVGEIVERDVEEPMAPVIPLVVDLEKIQEAKAKREAAFKNRLKGRDSTAKRSVKKVLEPVNDKSSPPVEEPLTEAEKIHKENLEKLQSMTPEQIEQERKELMEQLDPQLIQSLVNRAEKREKASHSHKDDHVHEHAEGYGGWIGGMKTDEGIKELSHLDKEDINKALGIADLKLEEKENVSSKDKHVRFAEVATVKYEDLPEGVQLDESGWEDVEDINDLVTTTEGSEDTEVAPKDYQLVNEDMDDVHFTKASHKSPEFGNDLDINDPEFYDKLHEKYYPDLPKETSKLAWMTEPLPKQTDTTYESISDMRFDFQGNLVQLKLGETPTYLGLHHHSENPHLPGYTLGELVHLSRSVVAGQRCISIQMLGRILHKLGLHKYNILPIEDNNSNDSSAFNDNLQQVKDEFEKMMWDLIDQLRVIDSIREAADEKLTRNLSVRNYAIEALWLWKQGGGRPKDNEDHDIEREVSNVIM